MRRHACQYLDTVLIGFPPYLSEQYRGFSSLTYGIVEGLPRKLCLKNTSPLRRCPLTTCTECINSSVARFERKLFIKVSQAVGAILQLPFSQARQNCKRNLHKNSLANLAIEQLTRFVPLFSNSSWRRLALIYPSDLRPKLSPCSLALG